MSITKEYYSYWNIQNPNVALSVSTSRLTETDPASIRAFLKQYDQYCRTIVSSAKLLQSDGDEKLKTTTTAVLSMELKYCVDGEHFDSCIELGLID